MNQSGCHRELLEQQQGLVELQQGLANCSKGQCSSAGEQTHLSPGCAGHSLQGPVLEVLYELTNLPGIKPGSSFFQVLNGPFHLWN